MKRNNEVSSCGADVEFAIRESLTFLREVGRTREDVRVAQVRFGKLKARHKRLMLELVVDAPPGRTDVDYDILVSNAQRETIMLGWHQDSGRPWSVDYGHHWAANYVLTADWGGRRARVSIREALTFLRESGESDPPLVRRLLDELILSDAIERAPPAVSEREIDHATDVFIQHHRLAQPDALKRWLEKAGMSEYSWRQWIAGGVRITKFKDRLCRGKVQSYFIERRNELASILVYRVQAREEGVVEQLRSALALASSTEGVSRLVGELLWGGSDVRAGFALVRGDALPLTSGDIVASGAIVGPSRQDGWYTVEKIIKVRRARLDASTRWIIRDRLVDAWLAAERDKVKVEWHW